MLAMCEAKGEAHKLRSQIAALAQMIDKLLAEMKSKPTRRTKRRQSITPTALSDEESKSEGNDEPPTPPPKPRRPKKKNKKQNEISPGSPISPIQSNRLRRGTSNRPGQNPSQSNL